jgi:hypothetical protein
MTITIGAATIIVTMNPFMNLAMIVVAQILIYVKLIKKTKETKVSNFF